MVIIIMTNKKLILHMVIFETIGVLLYLAIILLNVFKIIDIYNFPLNCTIFVISAIICLSYYAYIYQTHLYTPAVNDCVIMGIMTVCLAAPQIIFALKTEGFQLGIVAIWLGASLSLTVYNIISYLRAEDSICDVTKKRYAIIISKLKQWVNLTFAGAFLIGFVVVFFPDKLVIL